jgi:hypothetical protein
MSHCGPADEGMVEVHTHGNNIEVGMIYQILKDL